MSAQRVAICAILKDEGPYLPEWIAYHTVVGASRFYLYDNGSAEPVAQVAARLKHLVPIDVIPFPGRARQTAAYTDALKRAEAAADWVAFIDLDEFLVPSRAWTLADALGPYEDYGGLAVNWQTFGSSGHRARPQGLQLEAFTRRTPLGWSWNRHVKTLARPARALRAENPHYFSYRAPWFCVNEQRTRVPQSFSEPVSVGVLQVNHYFTRSRAEYQEKLRRGAADGTTKTMEFYDLVEAAATETDRGVQRFLPAVSSILAGLRK